MACIEISTEAQAEFIQSITQVVVAAAGDRQRAAELFAESLEPKGLGWLAQIVFDGIVKDVTPWHSGHNIEFTQTFTTRHGGHSV
jgi:hypothetical protein